ncbi:uncharacterized protein LOC117802255 [Ailuropoda melanoleuca]|uniref:uncharacterized protein LOC117802255 n=1 Tax=Ailuropoda melanoleuca TaxID=9646 RepID=UPI0014943044|nr:uncharacterized protein LOC117802255 [Ailuropoda melanoleuca]
MDEVKLWAGEAGQGQHPTLRNANRRATRSSPARAGGISTCGVHTKCCREGEAGEVGNAAVPGNQESDRHEPRSVTSCVVSSLVSTRRSFPGEGARSPGAPHGWTGARLARLAVHRREDEGRLVRLGRPEDPRKRKRLTLRVSGTGRRTCPGQGPRGVSALTVSAVQHKGETRHITLDLPVHLDAPRTSARTPRLCRGHVLCNCIKYLDRGVSILKLGFLTNDLKPQKQAWFYKQLLIKPNRITGIRTIKLNRNFMKT